MAIVAGNARRQCRDPQSWYFDCRRRPLPDFRCAGGDILCKVAGRAYGKGELQRVVCKCALPPMQKYPIR